MDVSVEISKTTPTSFMQVLVPDANLTNRMMSVARLHTAHAIGGKYSLVALGLIDNSITVGGDANLRLIGGGVFGNADTKCEGSAPKEPFLVVCEEGTPVDTCTYDSPDILLGSVDIVGEDGCKGQIVPPPDEGADPFDPALFELPAPNCTQTYSGDSLPIINGTLEPGLYCVTSDISFSDITATGVTFYLMNQAEIKINGNSIVELESPQVGGNPPQNGAIPGLLFFAPLSNHGGIQKNGDASGYFHGTWVLPGMNLVTPGWKGTFLGEFRGQMIVNNINMAGTFDGGVFYDTDWIYTIPASIDLLH